VATATAPAANSQWQEQQQQQQNSSQHHHHHHQQQDDDDSMSSHCINWVGVMFGVGVQVGCRYRHAPVYSMHSQADDNNVVGVSSSARVQGCGGPARALG